MQNILTKEVLDLAPGQVTALRLQRPLILSVSAGLVWITMEGNQGDYWLSAGQQLTLSAPGLLVIEAARQPGQIRLTAGRCSWYQRLREALQRPGLHAAQHAERRGRTHSSQVCR